ncbi:MAG: toll/interleukin-1 receptor domain-containing protein [Chitinophagaceae bacterium]
MNSLFSFKAFLSHKYEHPEVNLYFFNLFNENAQVQFELDAGKGATNVTRLERMIRDADAFIGIYPFLGKLDDADKKKQLQEQSKYFRLETELAVRARKPAIIFYDKRYGEMLKPPPGFLGFSFDINEITGEGESPNRENFKTEIVKFHELVKFSKAYEDRLKKERNRIAVFTPSSKDGVNGYTADCIESITSILTDKAEFEVEVIATRQVLNIKQLRFLDKIDFALVDAGENMMQTGIPAYLHGKFVPMLRLHFQDDDADIIGPPLSNSFLYGGIETGYPKDIICWNKKESLEKKLKERLDRLYSGYRRINTPEQAMEYFNSAAIKDKSVFLSYTNDDEAAALEMITSLKKRFKIVFNYKDTTSIPGSEPWLKVIFDRIAQCDVFISLYSTAYFKSLHCERELQHGVTQKLNGKKIVVYPVKLYQGEDLKLVVPEYASFIQYTRKYQYKGMDEIVEDIMQKLPD